MSRGRSNRARRRDSFSNQRLHSNDYVTRRRSELVSPDPEALYLQRLRMLDIAFGIIPAGPRPQAQPGRGQIRNEGRVFKAAQAPSVSFNQFKQGIDRINQQRAAIVGVERLKRSPVVDECVRRETRREVLMAKGVGGNKVAKPVFTDRSKIRCK